MDKPICDPESIARKFSMSRRQWTMCPAEGPIVAAAIHDGHDLSEEVAAFIAIDEATRLREEDPCTYRMTSIADNRLTVSASRFLVDLNRPREKAVYLKPEDAWGLDVWECFPNEKMIEHALGLYDLFYKELYEFLSNLKKRYGFFVVLDLHSYNHRREGPDAPPEDPRMNPDINVGTATLWNRTLWEPLIETFMSDLQRFDYFGRTLDVRENVKFQGGYMAEWIHSNFKESGCVLSIEIKKFFMDEWSGHIDLLKVEKIHTLLKSAMPGIEHSLKKMGVKL
ncbi:N-formylglutamate amidohydrolase [Hydrogenimonas sp.]